MGDRAFTLTQKITLVLTFWEDFYIFVFYGFLHGFIFLAIRSKKVQQNFNSVEIAPFKLFPELQHKRRDNLN